MTHRSIQRRGVILGGLLRGLVLMVWLLGVPGLRPVYHHHRDDGPGGGSATEQVRLSEHLRQYDHRDSADTAKLHFHWAVQLEGPGSQHSQMLHRCWTFPMRLGSWSRLG